MTGEAARPEFLDRGLSRIMVHVPLFQHNHNLVILQARRVSDGNKNNVSLLTKALLQVTSRDSIP